MGLFSSLHRCCDTFSVSLYVDDVVVFIKPRKQELKVIVEILKIFAGSTGLATNMTKTECFPIQCDSIDLSFLTDVGLMISQFPCEYLGMSLHYINPSRSMLQPIIQKIGNMLPG
jgi:hypothetical protein